MNESRKKDAQSKQIILYKYVSVMNVYNNKSNLTLVAKDSTEIQQCHFSLVNTDKQEMVWSIECKVKYLFIEKKMESFWLLLWKHILILSRIKISVKLFFYAIGRLSSLLSAISKCSLVCNFHDHNRCWGVSEKGYWKDLYRLPVNFQDHRRLPVSIFREKSLL